MTQYVNDADGNCSVDTVDMPSNLLEHLSNQLEHPSNT